MYSIHSLTGRSVTMALYQSIPPEIAWYLAQPTLPSSDLETKGFTFCGLCYLGLPPGKSSCLWLGVLFQPRAKPRTTLFLRALGRPRLEMDQNEKPKQSKGRLALDNCANQHQPVSFLSQPLPHNIVSGQDRRFLSFGVQ